MVEDYIIDIDGIEVNISNSIKRGTSLQMFLSKLYDNVYEQIMIDYTKDKNSNKFSDKLIIHDIRRACAYYNYPYFLYDEVNMDLLTGITDIKLKVKYAESLYASRDEIIRASIKYEYYIKDTLLKLHKEFMEDIITIEDFINSYNCNYKTDIKE